MMIVISTMIPKDKRAALRGSAGAALVGDNDDHHDGKAVGLPLTETQ